MQRLLRGRALYVVLGGLLIFLYLRTVLSPWAGSFIGLSATQLDRQDNTLEWWPKTVDLEAVQRIAARDPFVAVALPVLAVVVGGMAAGGLAFTLWGLWAGRLRASRRVALPRLPPWSFGELGRITLLTFLVAGLLPFAHTWLPTRSAQGPDMHLWITVSMLALDACLIVTILAFAAGKTSSIWTAVGVSSKHPLASIGVAMRAYVTAFPWLFAILFLVVELFRAFGFRPPAEPIQELVFQESRVWILGLTVVLACVVAPVAEELFFRGVLYPALRSRTSRGIAMAASGILFALAHTNAVGLIPIMALGCLLADLYERTGSLIGPLVVHVVHNTILMSLALVLRQLMVLSRGG